MSRVCPISGKGPLKGHCRRHPHSGAWVIATAPWPDDLMALRRQCARAGEPYV